MPPTRQAVLSAIEEFDRRDEKEFLDRYNFGKSRRYDLIYRGRSYPPKAIYGVAFKFSDGAPLTSKKLHGGEESNAPLRALGFRVANKEEPEGFDEEDISHFPSTDEDYIADRAIRIRRGQRRFRELMLRVYDWKCAVSGCRTLALLDAAHVRPYSQAGEYTTDNGVILRTDLHTLFDEGLLKIRPSDLTVCIDEQVSDHCYRELQGRLINQPKSRKHQISREFLKLRWQE